MIVRSRNLCEIIMMLVPLAVLIIVTAPASGDEADPTTPSLPITQFLAFGKAVSSAAITTVDAASKEPSTPKLRLKGIVFRDIENATALICLGDSELYVVSLRRSELQSSLNRLDIGSFHLKVIDFSDSCVFAMNLDTNQQLNIR